MTDIVTAIALIAIAAGLLFVVVHTRRKPEPRPKRPVVYRHGVGDYSVSFSEADIVNAPPVGRNVPTKVRRQAQAATIDQLLNAEEAIRFVVRVDPGEYTGLCIPVAQVYGKSVKHDPDGRSLIWQGVGPQGTLGHLLLDEALLQRLTELAFADPKALLTKLRDNLLVELSK